MKTRWRYRDCSGFQGVFGGGFARAAIIERNNIRRTAWNDAAPKTGIALGSIMYPEAQNGSQPNARQIRDKIEKVT